MPMVRLGSIAFFRRLFWSVPAWWAWSLAGCAAPPDAAARAADSSARPSAIASRIIGRSVQGREIECWTVGDGPMVIMLIATIHGNEAAGTPLLQRLAREATLRPSWMHDRTLVIVPVANPDGHFLGQRGNARGVDLNRNFPAASFTNRRRHGAEPLSEPESLALHAALMQRRPQRILSMHQPVACVDYDGDGAAIARAMSEAIAGPHALPVRKLGAHPGSLGSFAGEDLGIPIITVELPAAADRLGDEDLWARYGSMLIAGVGFPETVPSALDSELD